MSTKSITKITTLGSGAFGSAMAHAASFKDSNSIKIWSINSEPVESINKTHVNVEIFSKFKFRENVKATTDLKEALDEADIILSALPVQSIPEFLKKNKDKIPKNVPFVSCSKGMVVSKEKFISELFNDALGDNFRFCALSGPTFARELIEKNPSAAVIASKDKEAGEFVQKTLSSDYFRLYTQEDVIGVEIAAALKNVLAIGVGILEGLEYGYNTRAAFITRGSNEARRFSKLYGADSKTLFGLAGMGDLILTCIGGSSRNHMFGIRIGQGKSVDKALEESEGVVEGYPTLGVVLNYAKKNNLEMPLFTALYQFIRGEIDEKKAIKGLMGKELEAEWADI